MVGSLATPWTYDGAGRILSIPGLVTSAAYNAKGQTTTIVYANGIETQFVYNPARGFLDSVETKNGASVLYKYVYTRDATGRIVSVAGNVSGEAWTYTYDDA